MSNYEISKVKGYESVVKKLTTMTPQQSLDGLSRSHCDYCNDEMQRLVNEGNKIIAFSDEDCQQGCPCKYAKCYISYLNTFNKCDTVEVGPPARKTSWATAQNEQDAVNQFLFSLCPDSVM